MKVLVTGTAGFIGFHLATRLLNEGFNVIGIDSINDYYEVELKFGRLKVSGIEKEYVKQGVKVQSSLFDGYTFIQQGLEDEEGLSKLFEKEQFDMVVNLAAQAGVRYSLENPHAYINSNITGFVNILECCRKFGVKHLVYASSSSVYGLNSDEVFSTDHPVDHPVSLYAATKRSNELIAHVYSHLYHLPTTGLRFFTVYGPWGRPDMAPMLFTKAILSGKPISVFNYGEMRRDFTFIDDIVEGIFRVLRTVPTGKIDEFSQAPTPSNSPAPFAVYNIGNNSPIKLLDFINILEDELNKKAEKNMMPIQPGDVVSTYADVSPLVEQTGYKPSMTLKEGVHKFVKWYREFYKI